MCIYEFVDFFEDTFKKVPGKKPAKIKATDLQTASSISAMLDLTWSSPKQQPFTLHFITWRMMK